VGDDLRPVINANEKASRSTVAPVVGRGSVLVIYGVYVFPLRPADFRQKTLEFPGKFPI